MRMIMKKRMRRRIMFMGMMMRVKIKAHTTMPGELQVNDMVVMLVISQY